MKTQHIAALVLVAVIAGVAAGWWWGQRSATSPSTTDASSATAGRRVLYWHDPMVPGHRFDKPGKSPFMDMQLVPVYADEQDDAGGVRIDSRTTQNLGIRLGVVEKGVVESRLAAVGSVAFDERLLELVQTRVDGYVTKLHVRTPLERVRRGQALVEITSPQWLEAQQEYLATLNSGNAPQMQTIRAAARRRLAVLGVPEPVIAAIERNGETAPATTLHAPIDGVVTELGVRDGAAFSAGTTLFRINGLSSVWVNAQVPEAQAHVVTSGSTVLAHATGWPGTDFPGRVEALLPQVDPATRTLTARVSLANQDGRLAPGMFVSLEFSIAATGPQLLAPSEAIIATGQRTVVIAAGADQAFNVVDVTTGPESAGKTVILSGLSEGQSIVLSGQFLIDSEASLKSTLGRLGAVAPRDADTPHEPHP